MLDPILDLPIDRNSRVPLYQQIYEQIRSSIMNGDLPPTTALPSQKELSQKLEVNHITFRKAMAMLENDGLITRKRKVGTFVRESEYWKTEDKTHRLGIVCWGNPAESSDKKPTFKNDYTVDLLPMLLQEAKKLQIDAKVIRCYKTHDLLQEQVQKERIDGVVCFAAVAKFSQEQIRSLTIPRVAMEYEVRIPDVDNILIDSEPGSYQATLELIRLGHWDIAYVGALLKDRNDPNSKRWRMPQDLPQRLAGYRKALDDAGVPYQKDRLYEISMDDEPAIQLLEQLKRTNRLPTAICAFDDNQAGHILNACDALGISVPRDMSIVGFGNFSARASKGELATVEVDWPAMARIAVQRISERLCQGGIAGIRARVNTTFKPGTSIATPSPVM